MTQEKSAVQPSDENQNSPDVMIPNGEVIFPINAGHLSDMHRGLNQEFQLTQYSLQDIYKLIKKESPDGRDSFIRVLNAYLANILTNFSNAEQFMSNPAQMELGIKIEEELSALFKDSKVWTAIFNTMPLLIEEYVAVSNNDSALTRAQELTHHLQEVREKAEIYLL